MATTYSVNYDDERFQEVKDQQNQALQNANQKYDSMINSSDQFYKDQQNLLNQYEQEQTNLQNQRTEQAVNELNQQKEWLTKDYEKEQKGSYVDYQKAVNPYGVEAIERNRAGLGNNGIDATLNMSAYNSYQNRLSSARETYTRAIQGYDNDIANARLANSSALAELAYNTQAKILELALQGFQYKNDLLQQQLTYTQNIDNNYYQRYQDVLKQINEENALAEEARQWDEKMAYQRERDAIEDAQWQQQFNYTTSKSTSKSSSKSSSKSAQTNKGDGGISLTGAEPSGTKKVANVLVETKTTVGQMFSGAPSSISKNKIITDNKGNYYVYTTDGNTLKITNEYNRYQKQGYKTKWVN